MLLPNHGYLQSQNGNQGFPKIEDVYHIKADNSMKKVSERFPLHDDFYFYPWLNAYFEKSSLRRGPRIFYPWGSFSDVEIPNLFSEWLISSPSTSIGGVMTRAGMLWDVHQDQGDWKKQGLFLATSNGLLRIEEGSGIYSIVSPNGCRVVDNVLRGDPYRPAQHTYIWLVIDVCQENK